MSRTVFTPKDGGAQHKASLNQATGSGYDLVLFIDRVPSTLDSGWMLEIGVNADGSICGQITARPGSDSLASFICTQDTLRISDITGGPEHVISDAPGVANGQE